MVPLRQDCVTLTGVGLFRRSKNGAETIPIGSGESRLAKPQTIDHVISWHRFRGCSCSRLHNFARFERKRLPVWKHKLVEFENRHVAPGRTLGGPIVQSAFELIA